LDYYFSVYRKVVGVTLTPKEQCRLTVLAKMAHEYRMLIGALRPRVIAAQSFSAIKSGDKETS
jgi:hypothetical protein